MKRFSLVSWFAVLVLLLSAGPVRADPVDVELVARVLAGKEKPAVVLKINEDISAVSLALKRDDGKEVRQNAGPLRAGKVKHFYLPADPGSHRYEGELTVVFANGSKGSMPLQFPIEVVSELRIEVPYERLDLDAGKLQVSMSQAASRCEYEVTFDAKPTRNGVAEFAGEPAGTWLTVAWDKHAADDVVLRIRLRCFDSRGDFSQGIEIFPWWLEIPHEEVIFKSGKWDIETSEKPKLDRALSEIQVAVRRYGGIVDVKLFVSGHTDTVGDKAYNRTLSQNRARAICRYFRKQGVRIPILYTGFGEDQPAVPTPDETAEALNRRAQYVMGVQPPVAAGWSKL